MKVQVAKDKSKTQKVILTILILYVLTIVLGIYVIEYAYAGAHHDKRMQQVKDCAEKYMNGTLLEEDFTETGYVLDNEGNLICKFGEEEIPLLKEDITELGRKYMDMLLNGRDVFRFEWLVPADLTIPYTSILCMGTPVYENGTITGACFVFVESKDAVEVALGFIGIITLCYVAVLILLINLMHYVKKNQEAQKKYIDNVTHELKNPIASIKVLTAALSDDMEKNSDERALYYGMILSEANKQERMVRDILALSKLQGHSDAFVIENFEFKDIFNEIENKYAPLCEASDKEWYVTDNVRNIKTVRSDKKHLRQLFEIFITNSYKFSGEEGGKITLDCEMSRSKVTFCIEDNGIGIPDEDLSHIGERFFRAENASGNSGSGIGMSIAMEIIASLNEKMWIESRQNVGTKVFFTISRT